MHDEELTTLSEPTGAHPDLSALRDRFSGLDDETARRAALRHAVTVRSLTSLDLGATPHDILGAILPWLRTGRVVELAHTAEQLYARDFAGSIN